MDDSLVEPHFLISHLCKIGTNKAHFGSVTFVYVKFRWRGGGGEINTKISKVFKIAPRLYFCCGSNCLVFWSRIFVLFEPYVRFHILVQFG